MALAMMRSSASTWARAAISGTTPPNAACSLTWLKHHIGQDLAAAVLETFDHRRRGLVAGRLDAEDDHSFLISCLGPAGAR